MATAAIEIYNSHDVTESAISCNLGSGLMESMRIAPGVWHEGDLIDVVVRMRVGEVSHKPVHKDDFEGPYRRIHKAKALAVSPTTSAQVSKLLDVHVAAVSKSRELPGQSSIDDVIDIGRKRKRAKSSTPRKPRKSRTPAVATDEDAVVPGGDGE